MGDALAMLDSRTAQEEEEQLSDCGLTWKCPKLSTRRLVPLSEEVQVLNCEINLGQLQDRGEGDHGADMDVGAAIEGIKHSVICIIRGSPNMV